MFGLVQRAAIRYWERAARASSTYDSERIKSLRQNAKSLRRRLDAFIAAADRCLTQPPPPMLRRSKFVDWAWRPDSWATRVAPGGSAAFTSGQSIGESAKIFHDCALKEVSVRQNRTPPSDSLSAFGVVLEVFHFTGSFLSIAIDLPEEALSNLSAEHVFRLEFRLECEAPVSVFSRINIQGGPNVEQIGGLRSEDCADFLFEFDLNVSRSIPSVVQAAWIDIIFDKPHMNSMSLTNVTIDRRIRAAL